MKLEAEGKKKPDEADPEAMLQKVNDLKEEFTVLFDCVWTPKKKKKPKKVLIAAWFLDLDYDKAEPITTANEAKGVKATDDPTKLKANTGTEPTKKEVEVIIFKTRNQF